MTTTTSTDHTPRIWAGCESCYSNGRLVGVWIDAVDAADLTAEQIHAGSGVNPAAEGCEEFVCMDTDGLPISGEPSLEEAARWGELYDEVGDAQWPALCAWVRSGSYVAQGDTDLPVVSSFEDSYAGEWESFEDYVHELVEELGVFSSVPEELRGYVDVGRYARDLESDYTVERTGHGSVHVFRSL